MTNVPRPGWYPDPAGTSDAYRWWDGQTWTDQLSESANAPAPALADGDPVTTRRRSPLRAVVALVVVVALFLSAGVGVGLWLWDVNTSGNSAQPPNAGAAGRTSAPGKAGSADPSEPPGQLDEPTRTATIGDASMVLPDDPYALHSSPGRVRGVLDPVFLAEAEVHDRYDDENSWYAMVALAAVSPQVSSDPDLARSGAATMAKLATVLYGKQVTKVVKSKLADRSIDGNAGIEFTAQIHYAIDRLPSRYDTVRAIVVKLDNGTVVAALSAVPDDAGREVAELAEKSLESLTIN